MDELPEQGTDSIEEDAVLKQLVSSLPEELREVIILRYFQDLKYADIASILKISPSLAKYRVKKGLELLRQ